MPNKGLIVAGYLVSGIIVGGLLTIESLLGYPRSFNLLVLGIYDIYIVIHALTVGVHPIGLALFLPLAFVEIWIDGGLTFLLFFLFVAAILGIAVELDLLRRH
jgi:hypothetical protein